MMLRVRAGGPEGFPRRGVRYCLPGLRRYRRREVPREQAEPARRFASPRGSAPARTGDRVRRRARGRGRRRVDNRPDLVTGLTLGTAIAVVEKNFQQPGRSFTEDALLVLGTAAIIGVFNTVLVATIGICGYLLERAGHGGLASLLEAVRPRIR